MENLKEDRLKQAIEIFYSVEHYEDYEEHFNVIVLFLVEYLSWSIKPVDEEDNDRKDHFT